MLDAQGRIRSLAGIVPDLTYDVLAPHGLAQLRTLDPMRLPLVEGTPRLGPPVAQPRQFMALGLNYVLHAKEANVPIPKHPLVFSKAITSISGPNDDIPLYPGSVKLDYEAELALVIGKRATRVSADEALDYVFGYVPFMDISARGTGGRTMFQGKSYDTFGPLGPAIVTADEIADPHALEVRLSVNGQLRQRYSTADMANRIPQLIEYASHVCTLEPGDVIATGTNHQGLGPVQDGDSVALEIPGLGTLTVNVTDERKRVWSREIDQEMAKMVRGM